MLQLQEINSAFVDGNDQVTGHIISTTIGGKNGEPKQTISYMAERVVGTGSFAKNEFFLNLIMEYVLETIYRVLRHYSNINQRMPLIYMKLYTYQIFRGLAYIHTIHGVSHRDVKPQNLLVDPLTHQVKLCDFGSAKVVVRPISYGISFLIPVCGEQLWFGRCSS
ncbi:hypothetical protein IFM89_016980 [Coptis chinensis]|uniref:Protein kinase domain-containing protein n=1 Tax=Coptis chinensis TaxID=261450 RepID=A0A835HW30_9MAGN|nr:hypothetical protein IFM89_016980 [Coptis chinensis]